MNLGTFTSSTADSLWFNGVQQPGGEWGPLGSGADHQSGFFTGGNSARINVTVVPEPTAGALMGLAILSLAAVRARQARRPVGSQ